MATSTYSSSPEWEVKNPIQFKPGDLCQVMRVRTLNLRVLAYADKEMGEVEWIYEQIRLQLEDFLSGETR